MAAAKQLLRALVPPPVLRAVLARGEARRRIVGERRAQRLRERGAGAGIGLARPAGDPLACRQPVEPWVSAAQSHGKNSWRSPVVLVVGAAVSRRTHAAPAAAAQRRLDGAVSTHPVRSNRPAPTDRQSFESDQQTSIEQPAPPEERQDQKQRDKTRSSPGAYMGSAVGSVLRAASDRLSSSRRLAGDRDRSLHTQHAPNTQTDKSAFPAPGRRAEQVGSTSCRAANRAGSRAVAAPRP